MRAAPDTGPSTLSLTFSMLMSCVLRHYSTLTNIIKVA